MKENLDEDTAPSVEVNVPRVTQREVIICHHPAADVDVDLTHH